MTWNKLADSTSWSHGHSGKGYLLHDGTVKTWNLDPYNPVDQQSFHQLNNERSPIALNFDIDPDGGVVTDQPTKKIEQILQADPNLYDAGQRPVFEDDWDLDHFEPKSKDDSKPDFNFIMSSEALLPINMNEGCPHCGGPVDAEDGECLECGYRIPYDGYEALQGHDNLWDMAKQYDPGLTPIEGDQWGPRHYGGTSKRHLADPSYPMGFGDMYHVSPRKNRESILQNGLQGARGRQQGSPWEYKWDQPPGNYLFDNPEDAKDYIYTIHGIKHKGEDAYPEPGFEDQYEQDDPPEGFESWPEEDQEEWYDNAEYRERTDDPQGYDIHKVNARGLPIVPDPEAGIVGQGRGDKGWDLGRIHDVENGALDQWGHPQELSDFGSMPNRYYAGEDIPSNRVQLHEHVPTWGLTEEGMYSRLDNSYERESPEPWSHIPMTEWPFPGHESHTAASKDELHVALAIPTKIRKQIRKWCDDQDWPEGTELESPEEYHITLLYAPDGREEHHDADWIDHAKGYEVEITGLDEFDSEEDNKAIVLRISGSEVKQHANKMQSEAEDQGLEISKFPGGYKPHLTIAYGPGKPKSAPPKLKFKTGPSSVSSPRQSSWDPTICSHCGGSMSEPTLAQDTHQMWPPEATVPHYTNRCLNCGIQRTVPDSSPLLQRLRQQQELQPYPEMLNQVGPERAWSFGKVANSTGTTHRNRWTGKLCNCPWHGTHRSAQRMQRFAGEHINKLRKAPDKAYKTEEGKAFLDTLLEHTPHEYESLFPYLAHRWKKGEIGHNPEHGHASPAGDHFLTWNPYGDGGPPASRLNYNALHRWHQWYEARQHPTRRGVNIMDPSFGPTEMEKKSREHQYALEEERERKRALRLGKTVHTFSGRPGGGIDWDQAMEDYSGQYPHRDPVHDDLQRLREEESPANAYHDQLALPSVPTTALPTWQQEDYNPENFESAEQYREYLDSLHQKVKDSYTIPDRKPGWHIKELSAYKNDFGEPNNIEEAMEGEGDTMGHCIGSDEQPYKQCAANGTIQAYSLRDHKNEPHVTWHYNSDGTLAEMFGPNDDDPKPEYQDMLDEWGTRTGRDTNKDDAVGMQEQAEDPYDTYFTFPAATDVDSYLRNHGDNGPDYEYAEMNGNIGENTEFDTEEPEWDEIASDYLRYPSYDANQFHRTLTENNYGRHGHEGQMRDALEGALDPEDQEHRDIINQWNTNASPSNQIDLPTVPVNEVDKYNEAMDERGEAEPDDWDELAQDYLKYPEAYGDRIDYQPAIRAEDGLVPPSMAPGRGMQTGGDYNRFHEHMQNNWHNDQMHEALQNNVNWEDPEHRQAIEYWNQANPTQNIHPQPEPQPPMQGQQQWHWPDFWHDNQRVDDWGGYVQEPGSVQPRRAVDPYANMTVTQTTISKKADRALPRAANTAGWHDHFVNQIQPVAEAYGRLPHFDPKAEPAWQELAQDSQRRANEIRNRLRVNVTDDPEPYPDAQAMIHDINKGNFTVSRAHSEHPIWTPEQNVDFRIAHDVLGHHATGGGFDWQGENQACGNHFGLLTPNAQQALMTECLGQTGAAIANGGFGPQKVGFMNQLLAPAQQANRVSSMPAGGFCHRHLRHGVYQLGHYGSQRLAVEPMAWGQNWEDWRAQKPAYDASGHQLGYDPDQHKEGKGFVLDDGSVWTWPTHNQRPMHMNYNQYAKRNGQRVAEGSPFAINDGRIWQFGPGRSLSSQQRGLINDADPRLTFSEQPMGFGHGQNVLDTLTASSETTLSPAVELQEWLADLGQEDPPLSLHHQDEADFVSAPPLGAREGLPYFPPSHVPDEYKQSAERRGTTRSLYHGTLLDHLPTIRSLGLIPDVGGFTSDAYGLDDEGNYDQGDETPYTSEELGIEPAVFMTDKQRLDRSLTAMRAAIAKKLGVDFHTVTPRHLRNHGLLVKQPGEMGYSDDPRSDNYAQHTQIVDDNAAPEPWHDDPRWIERNRHLYPGNNSGESGVPYQAEPGDYFTDGTVGPQGLQFIQGPAMMRVFQRQGLLDDENWGAIPPDWGSMHHPNPQSPQSLGDKQSAESVRKVADGTINQADGTNDPLGKNPAIIPSRRGDPDWIKDTICPHCLQLHKADEPCPDSSVRQYQQAERAWYRRDPNAIHESPDGLQEHQTDLGKTATMTRNQYLRKMQELEAKMGPDKSRLHHQFPNGWSVVAPKSQRDIARVGQLMSHCWQSGFTGTGNPYVLRDPDQIPRVAWNITAPHMAGDGHTPPDLPPGQQVFAGGTHSPAGHNNSAPKPEHWDMLREWAAAQNPPVKMMHYMGPERATLDRGGYAMGEPGANPYFKTAKLKKKYGELLTQPGHQLWFEPGREPGRGFVHAPTNTVHTWPEADATHNEMAYGKQLEPRDCAQFYLNPQGVVTHNYGPYGTLQTIFDADPALARANQEWERTGSYEDGTGTHACPHCGHQLVSNGPSGWTGVSEGAYGPQSGWYCPGCGADFKPTENRPVTAGIDRMLNEVGNPLGKRHELWWKPGTNHWGRGLVHPDGRIFTWPEGEATHSMRARSLNIPDDYDRHFMINPQSQFSMHTSPGQDKWLDYVQTATNLAPDPTYLDGNQHWGHLDPIDDWESEGGSTGHLRVPSKLP